MCEPTIVPLPPLDKTSSSDDGYNDAASDPDDDDDDDDNNNNNNDNNNDNDQIRGDRLKEGKCPECGQQLFKAVRKGVLRKKIFKPLTIEGLVVRGQCVKCIATAGDEDLAVALAAMPEMSPLVIEPSNPVVPPPTATCVPTNPDMAQAYDTTYKGEHNDYGERHGEGVLTWGNGDKYVGSFWHGVREGDGTLHFNDGESNQCSNPPSLCFLFFVCVL